MSPVKEEWERRLLEMFRRAAAGDDVPPAMQLRAEGLMEALLLCGQDTISGLQSRMSELHEREMGESLEQRLGEAWAEMHPFPEIPVFMQRAPVYPSTHD
ncbi:MAG: hypothetical protein HRT76_08075 [Halieaceae bacterium]|nr:hypothetical protein [Halieaceae bacterium]